MLDTEENARVFNRLSNQFDHPDRANAGDKARLATDAIRRPGLFFPSEIDTTAKNGEVVLCGQKMLGPSGFVRMAGEIFGDNPQVTSGYYGYMSAMTHPTVFAFIETLADIQKLPDNFEEIPFKRDEVFAAKLAGNAVRDFYNAWRTWIAWTETGRTELDRVHHAHKEASSNRAAHLGS